MAVRELTRRQYRDPLPAGGPQQCSIARGDYIGVRSTGRRQEDIIVWVLAHLLDEGRRIDDYRVRCHQRQYRFQRRRSAGMTLPEFLSDAPILLKNCGRQDEDERAG
jgi:hypothetical protein